MDVKPGLHWLLEPVDGGGSFRMRPVEGWFEFGRPTFTALPEHSLAQGETELVAESSMRKDFSFRWEAILERRAIRQGTLMGKEEVHAIIRGTDREDLPAELSATAKFSAVELLQGIERYEEHQTVAAAAAAALAAAPATPSSATAAGAIAAEPPGGDAVAALPQGAVAQDTTGVLWERRKQRKALKRMAAYAEDAAVPDTANALFHLKSQDAEDFWDFADAEDDDEEDEGFDFSEQLVGLHQEPEKAVMAKEEADADEVKRRVPVSGTGAELSRLLRRDNDRRLEDLLRRHEHETVLGAAPGLSQAGPAEEDDELSEGDLSEGEACARRNIERREVYEGDEARPAWATAAPAAPAAKRPRFERPRPRAVAAVAAASASAPSAPSSAAPAAASRELIDKAVAFLCLKGGMATQRDACAALGVPNTKEGLKTAVAVYREVASIEQVPRQDRPVVMLKPHLWGSSEGPPALQAPGCAASCRWTYLGVDGQPVVTRAEAEDFTSLTARASPSYRVRLAASGEELLEVWLPAAKAPLVCPGLAGAEQAGT